jgi:hypothetical protein
VRDGEIAFVQNILLLVQRFYFTNWGQMGPEEPAKR